MAQWVKNSPAVQEMQETRVLFPGQEEPLEKGTATYCSILAWRIPWTEEPGGLQSIGSQRVGHTEATERSCKACEHNKPERWARHWWRGFLLRALPETISAASLLRLAQTSGLSIKLWFLFPSIPALEDRYVYVSMCRGDLSCLKSSPVWGFFPQYSSNMLLDLNGEKKESSTGITVPDCSSFIRLPGWYCLTGLVAVTGDHFRHLFGSCQEPGCWGSESKPTTKNFLVQDASGTPVRNPWWIVPWA